MTDEDVTVVTRNDKYAELKLAADVIGMVGLFYYLAHPDMFDKIGEAARRYRDDILHRVSVWTARRDIRSLPEIDPEPDQSSEQYRDPDFEVGP